MNKNEKIFLSNIAETLRIHSIRMTTAAGSGHPTSCLSAAEIMSVLFFRQMKYDPRRLDSPDNDGFILSKGHAAPILYAAYAEAGAIPVSELDGLRTFGSVLEGHPVPGLNGIRAATGSLGQGLSIAAGMAFAVKQDGGNQRVYTVLGDGEMAEGNVWEAMNFVSHYGLDNMTAVLDMNRLGQSEATMFEWNSKEYADRARAFGWETFDVDGHSIEELAYGFERAAASGKPALVIAKTVKGKNGGEAENADGYHGKAFSKEEAEGLIEKLRSRIEPVDFVPQNHISAKRDKPEPRNVSIETSYTKEEMVPTRTAFGKALAKIGGQDPDMIVLDGDVKGSSRTKYFFQEYPDRGRETYIAEQNMAGMLIGLQAYGKRAAAASFAAFLTRAHDQFRMGAYSRARFLIAGSHTGVSIGQDGPSQMGLEDIAMMRSIFGSLVLSPSDAVSAEKLTALGLNYKGIAYIRTIRGETPVIYDNSEEFTAGGSRVLKSSANDHATFVATGYTVSEALKAAERLEKEKNISVRVIDCYSLKPMDSETLRKAAEETKIIITVEDHYPEGGLGEAVASQVSGYGKVFSLSVTRMPHSGSPEKLIREQGIDAESILRKFHELLGDI